MLSSRARGVMVARYNNIQKAVRGALQIRGGRPLGATCSRSCSSMVRPSRLDRRSPRALPRRLASRFGSICAQEMALHCVGECTHHCRANIGVHADHTCDQLMVITCFTTHLIMSPRKPKYSTIGTALTAVRSTRGGFFPSLLLDEELLRFTEDPALLPFDGC